MREKINVLYYPEMLAADLTLKKAILFFDEIHFMDRPSFTFEGGLGTIGTTSPLRQFEPLFRQDNVPLFVHSPPAGRVHGEFLEQIAADVNDPLFLARFQEGIKDSETFRDQYIQHGQYSDINTKSIYTEKDLTKHFCSVDLPTVLSDLESAMGLLTDPKVRPFGLSVPASCAKTLIFQAAVCSAKMNVALNLGSAEGFIPLADADPYSGLLGAKYVRAIKKLDPERNRLPITDLSFAIFEELVSSDVLTRMEFPDVIRYRHKSQSAREEFLEYLGVLQQKQGGINADGDYAKALDHLIQTEVVPAAKNFRNKLQAIGESFFGSLVKGAMGSAGAIGGVQVLGDLSLGKILGLAGLVSAYVGQAAVDAYFAQRTLARECSLSYILSLD